MGLEAFSSPISDRPRFGHNCPRPDELNTGDLLFPRRLHGAASFDLAHEEADMTSMSADYRNYLAKRVRDIVSDENDVLSYHYRRESPVSTGLSPDITRLRFSPSGRGGQTHGFGGPPQVGDQVVAEPVDHTSLLVDPYAEDHPSGKWLHPASLPEMDRQEFDRWMLLILKTSLRAIPEDWLDMTVEDFHKHPIWDFLVEQLMSPDPTLSFFVGHVGVVLKEGGSTWVIEANITDYSHYRVAIHPYYVAEDQQSFGPAPPSESLESAIRSNAANLRGWVNRRCALGELTWWARPKALTDEDREKLPNLAKRYMGRPYGFFDHPGMGHSNRFYCSEFVYRVFCDVRPELKNSIDDQRTWGGMLNHLHAAKQGSQADMVDYLRRELGKRPSDEFFVFPPALLWRSDGVRRSLPGHAGGTSYA
jgi:hypothetical protein